MINTRDTIVQQATHGSRRDVHEGAAMLLWNAKPVTARDRYQLFLRRDGEWNAGMEGEQSPEERCGPDGMDIALMDVEEKGGGGSAERAPK
ncbi:unnamed protein product [Arctogadus glacialis]